MNTHAFADPCLFYVFGDNEFDLRDVQRGPVFGQEQEVIIEDELSCPVVALLFRVRRPFRRNQAVAVAAKLRNCRLQ